MSEESRPIEPSRNLVQAQQVHLLFRERPEIDEEKILEALRRRVGKVEMAAGEKPGLKLFFFPDHTLQYQDGELPAQCHLLVPEESTIDLGRFETARQQSWHWPAAFEEVKASRHEFFLSDFMSERIPAPARMEIMGAFVRSVAEVLKPDVVFFVHADRLDDPKDLLKTPASEEPLHGFVNVRLFRLSDDPNQSLFMDTLGLHALGLPDFEIYFSSYPANEVANKLIDYAYYLLEEGSVIGDGNEMMGMTEDEQWTARRMDASVGPEREVIRIQNKDFIDGK